LVQDNGWDISANAKETRAQNAFEYAQGFHGLEAVSVDGTDFETCYTTIKNIIETIRKERRPFLVHAKVPLLNHHTSGVRMEWYRDYLDEACSQEPYPRMRKFLLENGISEIELAEIENSAYAVVKKCYQEALQAEDPKPQHLFTHDCAPTPISNETRVRSPEGAEKVVMVDCALHAIEELMQKHPEC